MSIPEKFETELTKVLGIRYPIMCTHTRRLASRFAAFRANTCGFVLRAGAQLGGGAPGAAHPAHVPPRALSPVSVRCLTSGPSAVLQVPAWAT